MKKICSFLLALLLLCGLLPAMSLRSEAASQVYYPVDFSAAMINSGIGQKNSGDCLVVSMATIEAYFYGATSSADKTKVYNAFTSVNNDSGNDFVPSYARVGYAQMSSHTLAAIYNEIAQGNPVVIHRSVEGHYGVVCGYTGSTSTLEASGFLVASPQRDPSKVTKQSLTTFLKGGSITEAVKRRKGIAVTNLGGIRITSNYPEIVHKYGTSHGVYGRVTSDANLTNVTVTVTNYDTDAVIYNKSVNPASKNCSLLDTFDSGMSFASWAVGKYLYKITAKDANGKSAEFLKYFTIASSYPATAPKSPIYNAAFTWNDSQNNYLHGTDFANGVPYGWASRDTSVSTIAVDSSVKHNGYASLKIVNKSAGASGKDLQILTQTNDRVGAGWVGDSKTMTLSFWAKASVSGTKMYFRWGFETSYRSVTLSTSWQKYTVRMDKTTNLGYFIHPYVDRAGTVWITEVQLEDGTSATQFYPDQLAVYSNVTEVYGKKYILPDPAPTALLYEFDGWYTSKRGGTRVTSSTTFPDGKLRVYAHWRVKTPFEGLPIPWHGPILPDTDPCLSGFSFTDVPANLYCFEPVVWAYYHDPQITSGTSATTFSPNADCTRGEVVTFLWRAAGKPEPKTTKNPFKDVKTTDFFYKPVLWAVEKGITKGTSATTFSPKNSCTRSEVVTFLWRADGSQAPTAATNPFKDVNTTDWFYRPVLWAVEKGITKGTSATIFSPKKVCTRGEVVTFLYRDLA